MLALLFLALVLPVAAVAYLLGRISAYRVGLARGLARAHGAGAASVYRALAEQARTLGYDADMVEHMERLAAMSLDTRAAEQKAIALMLSKD